jgi:phosphate starvation-inducible protein PhoH and related proteins
MTRRKNKQSNNSENLKVKPLTGKTQNQKDYIRSIIENQIIYCTGPAGSGKSFIAAGIACSMLHRGDVGSIVVARPLVSAGERIGALPGELGNKIDPYLKPMKKHLRFFLGNALYGKYLNSEQIIFETLELMRGETYDESVIILDEAQNCTEEQIIMLVTRMGSNSKVVINGDIRQYDIRNSGFSKVVEKTKDVPGISLTEFGKSDIQRNGILASFLEAAEND